MTFLDRPMIRWFARGWLGPLCFVLAASLLWGGMIWLLLNELVLQDRMVLRRDLGVPPGSLMILTVALLLIAVFYAWALGVMQRAMPFRWAPGLPVAVTSGLSTASLLIPFVFLRWAPEVSIALSFVAWWLGLLLSRPAEGAGR